MTAAQTNDRGPTFSVGQVFRDTYGDNDPRQVARIGMNKRTIRIIGIESDGRYLAETLTDMNGTALIRSRKTRVSEKTLLTSYVSTAESK